MSRRVVFGCVLLIIAACSSAPVEQQLLTVFFRAARAGDNTTLANLATVEFDPKTNGSVAQFTVSNIGEQQHRTVEIQQLTEAVSKARKDRDTFTQEQQAYLTANAVALDRIAKAQRARQPIRGKDAEILTAYSRRVGDGKTYEEKFSEALTRESIDRAAAAGSLTAPGRNAVDISGMSVDIITEPVTISAQLTSPGGQTSTQTLVVTLLRAVGKKADQTTEGRWLVTGVTPQGAAPKS